MEDLYTKHGITEDKKKITMLGKYTDAASKAEWQHLDSYEEEDWKKFRKELIESYVKACDIERGLLKALQKICQENRKITATDLSDLMALKRGFRVKVKKLQKEPTLLSNWEAVEMFLDCLNPDFCLLVTSHLDIVNRVIPGGTRLEDKYKLDDMIDTVVTLGKGSRVTYKVLDRVAPSPSRQDVSDEGSIKLEAELCILKDTFVMQNKQSEAHINRLASCIEEMKSGKCINCLGVSSTYPEKP